MEVLLIGAFFALGTVLASFVGVLTVRLHTGQSFLTGRSRCDACNAQLSSGTLVPIISYLVQEGRARCCGARLSFYAPLVEGILGVIFAMSYARIGLTLALPCMLLALTLLLALVLYDLAHQILPPLLLAAFVAVSAGAGFLLSSSLAAFYTSCIMALILSSSLALIHFFSNGRAMGFSDAPLTLGLSLLVGSPFALAGFLFSFWIGGAIGIVLLFTRPVGSRMGIEVPFAPFLAAGFLLAYFTQWNPLAFVVASL